MAVAFFLKFTPQSCIWHVIEFFFLFVCFLFMSLLLNKVTSGGERRGAVCGEKQQECLLYGWVGGGGRGRPGFGGILQRKKM